MSAHPISPGAIVGSVATAATTGALIAIGHRAGASGLPFAATSAVLLHRAPASGGAALVVTGLIVHVATTIVWSTICVWLFEHVLWRPILCALAVAFGQFFFSGLVAQWTGYGLANVLPLGDRLVFALVLAASLAVGMRFAFFPREMHDRSSPQRAHPL